MDLMLLVADLKLQVADLIHEVAGLRMEVPELRPGEIRLNLTTAYTVIFHLMVYFTFVLLYFYICL